MESESLKALEAANDVVGMALESLPDWLAPIAASAESAALASCHAERAAEHARVQGHGVASRKARAEALRYARRAIADAEKLHNIIGPGPGPLDQKSKTVAAIVIVAVANVISRANEVAQACVNAEVESNTAPDMLYVGAVQAGRRAAEGCLAAAKACAAVL